MDQDEIAPIRSNLNRMLQVLAERGDEDSVRDAIAQFASLLTRLERAEMLADRNRIRKLEEEFVGLAESGPLLRLAMFVAFKMEVLEICMKGLQYYEDIKSHRQLSDQEFAYLQSVETQYKSALEEYDRAKSDFLRASPY